MYLNYNLEKALGDKSLLKILWEEELNECLCGDVADAET